MLRFIRQYVKDPRSIGAIAPSSGRLVHAMMQPIDFETARCIMEFGPGTGVFTDAILRRRKNSTTLILIELNDEFFQLLKDKYADVPNLFIVHGSAELADSILKDHGFKETDYVVSSLPFTTLPKTVSLNVFRAVKNVLGENGKFITFQYTLLKQDFFAEFFRFADVLRVLVNLPPAYVFVLKND